MEKLIKNAQSQFNKNGEILISIYPNGICEDECQVVCKSFEDAIELIQNTFFSQQDDIRVPHLNAL